MKLGTRAFISEVFNTNKQQKKHNNYITQTVLQPKLVFKSKKVNCQSWGNIDVKAYVSSLTIY